MTQNLEMVRGDSLILRLEVSREGQPEDITGAQIWMTAKKLLTDADPGVFQKTVGSGVVIDDPTQGKAKITISPADTAALVATGEKETLFYDVQVKYAGNTFTVKSGKLIVKKDVTVAA